MTAEATSSATERRSAFDLRGKRAVVTGVSTGIGAAIAATFARAGADIAGISLDDSAETEQAVRREGREAVMLVGDTGDPAAVQELARAAVERLGGIDVWVNNAARLFVKRLVETSNEDWHGVLAANLHGYFYGCRAAAARMLEQKTGGRIVNVTSATNVLSVADLGAYATAKGGIAALTKVLALELAPAGVTVNAIAPGPVDTPLNKTAYTPEVRRRYEERVPLGRIGSAEDVADVALFLASDASRFVTGQELLVDGGMSINGSVGHKTG